MHFQYFCKVFAFAFELFKWKVFAFEKFSKYFSNTFEIIFKFFKILLVDQNWFKIWWILFFVTILIVFNHITQYLIIIIKKIYYFSIIISIFYWDGVPVKVFESIWKSIWNTFEKYLHLHLKKIKVFAFAFEKFRSICICI